MAEKKYFYGNEISEYGIENGYVDYRCLSKAFDAVLNNGIYNLGWDIGYGWEQQSGFVDNQDEIDELQMLIDALGDDEEDERERIEGEIEELEYEQENDREIYQYYIVSDSGARILAECNEIVWYHEKMDMYLWGVTHWGTAWSHVLTDIKIDW